MITKRLSGECYKITGHLFLDLTLSGEYGNISFLYERYTVFSAKTGRGTEWVITKVGQLSANWWENIRWTCTQV